MHPMDSIRSSSKAVKIIKKYTNVALNRYFEGLVLRQFLEIKHIFEPRPFLIHFKYMSITLRSITLKKASHKGVALCSWTVLFSFR